MYDLFEGEAKNCLAHGLVIPAHDLVLRCSHTFNLLDSRGAIGVTERANYFARMRDLAREVSVAYFEQRQSAGHPWLSDGEVSRQLDKETSRQADKETNGQGDKQAADERLAFLLEIGTEELPAADVADAINQLRTLMPRLLEAERLNYGQPQVSVMGTPRRLAVLIEDLPAAQASTTTIVKGPPAERAFLPDGTATQAAIGFARKNGVPVDALQIREEGTGRYVFAEVRQRSRPAADVLAEVLPWLMGQLVFLKTMRWNSTNVAFSRPIRWLVSLLGDTVVPFEYAGLPADRVTRGPRAEGSPEIEVVHADDYGGAMTVHQVIIHREGRKAEIVRQITALAEEVGGRVPDDPGLLDEVTDLVEQPTALRGDFAAEYLRLPKEVLITVMKKHQRYFPVVNAEGGLMPYFIAVRNGGARYLDVVQAGNEGVLRARYADADYFFNADSVHKLEEFTPRLGTLTFQVKLGSMLDKVQRVQKLSPAIGAMLGLDDAEESTLQRAAALFKSDLVTQMVVELTRYRGLWAAKVRQALRASRRLWPTRSTNTTCRASRGMRCRPAGRAWRSGSPTASTPLSGCSLLAWRRPAPPTPSGFDGMRWGWCRR
jgi:glycyl-tRNA synthetase